MAYKIEEFSSLFQTADYVTKHCMHSFCVDSIYSIDIVPLLPVYF